MNSIAAPEQLEGVPGRHWHRLDDGQMQEKYSPSPECHHAPDPARTLYPQLVVIAYNGTIGGPLSLPDWLSTRRRGLPRQSER